MKKIIVEIENDNMMYIPLDNILCFNSFKNTDGVEFTKIKLKYNGAEYYILHTFEDVVEKIRIASI